MEKAAKNADPELIQGVSGRFNLRGVLSEEP
jgi:hypothetical protein